MNPLRTAVIGLGWWGRQIVTCLQESARFRVTYGVDVAPAAVADFARDNGLTLTDSLEAVLADAQVDAVVIATPHRQHEAQALAVLAAGKQLFCEKPLTLTADGAERILAACDRAGVVLGIGHERRFEPAMEEARRMIDAGELGQLLHLEANVSHNLFARMAPGNWRIDPADAPAGAMTALGIHLTDMFVSLAGNPLTVRARTARVMREASGTDQVSIWIEFDSGITAAVTCLSSTPFHGRMSFFGSDGWVEVKENGNVDKGLPSDLTHCNAALERHTRSYLPVNTVRRNFEAWAAAIAGQTPYRFTRAQILNNIRVLDAVVRSAASGGELIRIQP
jgi:predicted dehydrogenase